MVNSYFHYTKCARGYSIVILLPAVASVAAMPLCPLENMSHHGKVRRQGTCLTNQ